MTSVLLRRSVFRACCTLRVWRAELIAVVLVFGSMSWWALSFNHVEFSRTTIAQVGPWPRWLATHDAQFWFPVALAVLVTLILRWIDVSQSEDPSITDIIRMGALAVVTLGLPALYLAEVPGTLLTRYGPLLVGVGVAWLLHRMRDRGESRRPRPPTAAGFRPQFRTLLGVRSYVALSNCARAEWGTAWISSNSADTAFDDAAAWFAQRGDQRTAAYCTARAIDYLVAHNRLSDAETRSTAAMQSPLVKQPAVLASRAMFLRSVGLRQEALLMLEEARRRSGRRAPDELQSLYLHATVEADSSSGSAGWRWSDARRARMILAGRSAAVLMGYVDDARALAQGDPDVALTLAYRTCHIAENIGNHPTRYGLNLVELSSVLAAKAAALATIGSIYEDASAFGDAAMAYTDAYDEYSQILDRTNSGSSILKGFANAIRAGYSEPSQEAHALDMIRVGLQIVEDDRGALRSEANRVGWVKWQRDLYSLTFETLNSFVEYHDRKAGELGLWLVESLHRSALACMLRGDSVATDEPLLAALAELAALEATVHLAADPSAPMEPRPDLDQARRAIAERFTHLSEAALVAEPTDVDAVLHRLGERVALLYHCRRETSGWVFFTVLVASGEISIHRSVLDIGPEDFESAWFLSPGRVLDAVLAGDPEEIRQVFLIQLGDEVWQQIAAAVLPPRLKETLRASRTGSRPADLLIVPEGPIAGLPLAALPLDPETRLIEAATIALVPALSMLHSTPIVTTQDVKRRVAVTHLDDVGLSGTAQEAESWDRVADLVEVRPTQDLACLDRALARPPSPDIAVISAHGTPGTTPLDNTVRLRDGSVLSAASALRLHWPPTVILGTCWTSAVAIDAGREPLGFPIACLLRGATTVIGGIAPIKDVASGNILVGLINGIPTTTTAIQTLRDSIVAQLVADRGGDWVTPSKWAALATWTIAPSRPRRSPLPRLSTHWLQNGIPSGARCASGTFTPQQPWTERMRVALSAAHKLAPDRAIDSATFLSGSVSSDPQYWDPLVKDSGLAIPDVVATSDDNDGGGLSITIGLSPILVTNELAESINRGERLITQFTDQDLAPEHVVFAAMIDSDSIAAQRLRTQAVQESDFGNRLVQRMFGTRLPDVDLLAKDSSGKIPPKHNQRRVATRVSVWRPNRKQISWASVLLVACVGYVGTSLGDVSRAQAAIDRQGYVGVTVQTVSGGRVLVRGVQTGSPAASAGLRRGDYITAVNNMAVDSGAMLIWAFHALKPGQRASVVILRTGSREELEVKLGHAP